MYNGFDKLENLKRLSLGH